MNNSDHIFDNDALWKINEALAKDTAKLAEFARLTVKVKQAQLDLTKFLEGISKNPTQLWEPQRRQEGKQSLKLAQAWEITDLETAKHYVQQLYANNKNSAQALHKLVAQQHDKESQWRNFLDNAIESEIIKLKHSSTLVENPTYEYVLKLKLSIQKHKFEIYLQMKEHTIEMYRQLNDLQIPLFCLKKQALQNTVKLEQDKKDLLHFIFDHHQSKS